VTKKTKYETFKITEEIMELFSKTDDDCPNNKSMIMMSPVTYNALYSAILGIINNNLITTKKDDYIHTKH
jgi:hypothetical protein